LTAQPVKILLVFCITIGHHLSLPYYSNNASSPYTATQQAAPSQSQPQPRGSSHSHAPSQSRSRYRRHQAAIANVPESGEEFDFTSVDHEDTSPIRSNVATVNSTPLPSVQAQPVDLPACKGSSRDAVDINHFFLDGNVADQCGVMTLRQLCSLCL